MFPNVFRNYGAQYFTNTGANVPNEFKTTITSGTNAKAEAYLCVADMSGRQGSTGKVLKLVAAE